ncbi:MAG TPA: ABC transporter ATP-binding protein [Anaerolineae bacterium]
MLEIKDIHTYYGHIHALKGVSFQVPEGAITAILGANGAGKSTAIKTICGLMHPREGEIRLNGKPIQRLPADQVVRLGVGYVPEGRRIFPVLTVDENLDMGAYHRSDHAGIAQDKERMYTTFPILRDRRKQLAGSLSGGEQQMLAIARALMSRPRLLVMDEPSLGLAPLLVKHVFEIIADLNRQGMTILVCEQNARAALQIAHHGIVMETGKMRFADTADALRANPVVQQAYLGVA